MANHNGSLVLKVLKKIPGRVTVSKVINRVAGITGANIDVVKPIVEDTLKGGLMYGYLQLRNRNFFTFPQKLEAKDVIETKDKVTSRINTLKRRNGYKGDVKRAKSKKKTIKKCKSAILKPTEPPC